MHPSVYPSALFAPVRFPRPIRAYATVALALVARVPLPIVTGALAARVVLTLIGLQETARAGLPAGDGP
ncbi:hypothetical protein AB0F88_25220 [Streptosporangium sp. NPDC023963]|uniref:hypothetical protein n=1 Tax=Streptosporangium sp. NPDC023963 TaxID=3155608 RepID=UPI00344A9314